MTAEALGGPQTTLRYELQSTPEAVRDTLIAIKSSLLQGNETEMVGDMWELVVAEVLNNIVEHAYSERKDGAIEVELQFANSHMSARFVDYGDPMPDGALPANRPADIDVPTQDLPEGGFGWHLIHTLSDSLNYERRNRQNCLFLEMTLVPGL